jgi:hypothetical protein
VVNPLTGRARRSATQGTRQRLAGGEVERAVDTGHGRGRGLHQSTQQSTGRPPVVVRWLGGCRSEAGVEVWRKPWHDDDEDDDTVAYRGRELVQKAAGGTRSKTTRTGRQMRAQCCGEEHAGGEELRP